MRGSCHCGAVAFEAPAPPSEVTDCNCSTCRRYGTLWAYYPASQVRVTGETHEYMWGDKAIAFHRCKTCGNVTHWSSRTGEDRLGLNMRLADPAVLKAARVRHLDGASDNWQYLD